MTSLMWDWFWILCTFNAIHPVNEGQSGILFYAERLWKILSIMS